MRRRPGGASQPSEGPKSKLQWAPSEIAQGSRWEARGRLARREALRACFAQRQLLSAGSVGTRPEGNAAPLPPHPHASQSAEPQGGPGEADQDHQCNVCSIDLLDGSRAVRSGRIGDGKRGEGPGGAHAEIETTAHWFHSQPTLSSNVKAPDLEMKNGPCGALPAFPQKRIAGQLIEVCVAWLEVPATLSVEFERSLKSTLHRAGPPIIPMIPWLSRRRSRL